MADQILCTPDQVSAVWSAFANLSPTLQTMLINTSSQAIIDFCNRTFDQTNQVAEPYDGKNTGVLWLKKIPVVSVTQIVINNQQNTLTNADGRDWVLYPKNGKLIRGVGLNDERFAYFWPRGNQNILIDYLAGFAAIPDKVIMAACLFTRYYYMLTKNTMIYQSESLGDYSYTLAPIAQMTTMTMPTYIADLISEYVLDVSPQ
jgi:hypothetical protein